MHWIKQTKKGPKRQQQKQEQSPLRTQKCNKNTKVEAIVYMRKTRKLNQKLKITYNGGEK